MDVDTHVGTRRFLLRDWTAWDCIPVQASGLVHDDVDDRQLQRSLSRSPASPRSVGSDAARLQAAEGRGRREFGRPTRVDERVGRGQFPLDGNDVHRLGRSLAPGVDGSPRLPRVAPRLDTYLIRTVYHIYEPHEPLCEHVPEGSSRCRQPSILKRLRHGSTSARGGAAAPFGAPLRDLCRLRQRPASTKASRRSVPAPCCVGADSDALGKGRRLAGMCVPLCVLVPRRPCGRTRPSFLSPRWLATPPPKASTAAGMRVTASAVP